MAQNEWIETTLGAIAKYINGMAFKPEDWEKHGLPIIRIEQINNPNAAYDYYSKPVMARYYIDSGDLLFSWSATLTTVIWTRGAAILNQHIFKVIPSKDMYLNFLYHLLSFLINDLGGQTHGSTMKHIKRSDLIPYKVRIPKFAEQQRIAEILDTLDATISATEQLIAKLRNIKTGLLHDLLSYGLDTHGNIRDPQVNPEHFKASVLGNIPREWEVKSIATLASHVKSGITPTGGSNVYQSSGVMFIRSQNVAFEGLLLDNVAYISNEIHRQMLSSEIYVNDVLLNITGASIGRCCVVPDDIGIANVNQHVCAIRLDRKSFYNAQFLCYVLASYIGQSQIDRLNAGGNREGLNYAQIRSFQIPWPNDYEIKMIVQSISTHENRIRAEEAYCAKLKAMKQGLMEDLLTGTVRV